VNRPVVIKVGGSLLDWPALPERLSTYLESQGAEARVLIVGGGKAADVVRELDGVHNLGPRRSHTLALHAMDLTAHLLAALLPTAQVVTRVERLPTLWRGSALPILSPRRFLDGADARSPDPLPASWDVTSDSIAARVAVYLQAQELVLLKSAPIPPDADRNAAARLGLVDPAFPGVARGLDRIAYVNLRDPLGTSAFL
jgi:5-(aminomethyl)-3-furanmethanol phosphate kinase